MIWSPSNRDWKANIQTIKPNPTATRYARPTDVIPLRNEQLYSDIITIEELIALRNQGVLSWSWAGFPQTSPSPETWSETGKDILDRASSFHSGRKTCEALVYVIDWFERNDPIRALRFDDESRAAFWINGIRVHIGRPSGYCGYLEHHSCSGIMLVPHLSRRGPNGIWTIRRGNHHPIEKLFREATAYCFLDDNGKPALVNAFSDWESITLLELFRTDQAAQAFAKEMCEEDQGPADEGLVIAKISGSSILEAISSVDHITIDSNTYAISPYGRRFDGEAVLWPDPIKLRQLLMGSADTL